MVVTIVVFFICPARIDYKLRRSDHEMVKEIEGRKPLAKLQVDVSPSQTPLSPNQTPAKSIPFDTYSGTNNNAENCHQIGKSNLAVPFLKFSKSNGQKIKSKCKSKLSLKTLTASSKLQFESLHKTEPINVRAAQAVGSRVCVPRSRCSISASLPTSAMVYQVTTMLCKAYPCLRESSNWPAANFCHHPMLENVENVEQIKVLETMNTPEPRCVDRGMHEGNGSFEDGSVLKDRQNFETLANNLISENNRTNNRISTEGLHTNGLKTSLERSVETSTKSGETCLQDEGSSDFEDENHLLLKDVQPSNWTLKCFGADKSTVIADSTDSPKLISDWNDKKDDLADEPLPLSKTQPDISPKNDEHSDELSELSGLAVSQITNPSLISSSFPFSGVNVFDGTDNRNNSANNKEHEDEEVTEKESGEIDLATGNKIDKQENKKSKQEAFKVADEVDNSNCERQGNISIAEPFPLAPPTSKMSTVLAESLLEELSNSYQEKELPLISLLDKETQVDKTSLLHHKKKRSLERLTDINEALTSVQTSNESLQLEEKLEKSCCLR